ncbi:MAG TPA: ABC transporter ATP-binding protein/permease [Candidatus Dormibacteraeota bacterium]|nr:ABC transporter ATP-binding protein/permease [Candidatus Dormibacteraeota bacterium]
MAQALDDRGGDPGGSRLKRRRRRTRADAAAILPPPEPSSPPVEVAPEPQAFHIADEPVAVIPAVLLPTPDAPEDRFTDLLGQAVGLRLDSVSREFGGENEMHVTALKDVSLEIGPCEFVSIVGPSGCGKTTLLSLMGGLDRPTSGHVYAAGLPLGELSDSDLADYRLQRVSTIFQTFNLVPSMSVQDNVALPLTLAGVELEERRRRARHLLELVGLEGRALTRAGRLSGGEQQKVAVARALANRPGLILADEPTGSLDSSAGEVILQLLADLNRRGATVVLVTHDPAIAQRARRVVRMIDGRAIEVEPGTRTVRKQDSVASAARLHWRDGLKVGLGSAGRRPLRTALTTTGVAIGIAAMSLIVALAGGLQSALSAPALSKSQLHQVAVAPATDANTSAFDAASLATLSGLPHVRAAWGEVTMSGTFNRVSPPASASASTTPALPAPTAPGALVSLPPRGQSSTAIPLSAGRLPFSDSSKEILLTNTEATALGFANPFAAIGKNLEFNAAYGGLTLPGSTPNPATKPVTLSMLVVGIVSSQSMPGGASGGLVPYRVAGDYWTQLAKANGWKRGEYSSVTLLADSGAAVDGLRSHVEALGFQAQTFGDQFRGFEDLLGRLRLALLGLAVVALLLACLGIANTMYTAVLERTKEIGVLKALGARRRDVLLLFVAEAAVIGLAGGLVGTLIALGLARLGNTLVDRLAQSVTGVGLDVFRTDLAVVLVALALAVILSTVSGLLPAVRAARHDPSRALRYE